MWLLWMSFLLETQGESWLIVSAERLSDHPEEDSEDRKYRERGSHHDTCCRILVEDRGSGKQEKRNESDYSSNDGIDKPELYRIVVIVFLVVEILHCCNEDDNNTDERSDNQCQCGYYVEIPRQAGENTGNCKDDA